MKRTNTINMIKSFCLATTVVLLSSCSVIMDPMGTSLDNIELSREKATVKIVDRSAIKVREDIRILAEKNEWVLFQYDEEAKCLVIMGVPQGTDTTETGIFVTEVEDSKTKIEVTSLNRKQQALVAKSLFELLDKRWTVTK